jgi:hypothetical protein
VLIGSAPPERCLAPRPSFGAAEPLTRPPPLALATRPGVACTTTGLDRLPHDGRGQPRRHRCCRAHEPRGRPLSHTPAWPAVDDLGSGPVRRGEALRGGRGPALAWEGEEALRRASHRQPGLGRGRPRLPGPARPSPATDGWEALAQPGGALLGALASDQRGPQAPSRCAGQPPPGSARARQDRRGPGERRCVLAHDAPACVPGARGARPGGAAPGGHGPTRASGALEPAAAGLPLARDETARPAGVLPCGPGPPRPGGMRLLRAPTAGRRALAHRPWALTRGAEPARHAASSATTDPRCVAAARAVRRAWRGRTVACGALPDSLLLRTVGRTSGGDSAGPRLSLVHMHPRYRGTPP